MSDKTFSEKEIQHLSQLAHIPVSREEQSELAQGFNETLDAIKSLQTVKASQVEPTHQVTGLKNVFREDEVDKKRMFTQEQALSGADHTHDGYFVVESIAGGWDE